MTKVFYFLFGFITMLYLLMLAVVHEGAFDTPLFLEYDLYHAIWHGSLAHTWSIIQVVVSVLFYLCVCTLIFNWGRKSHNNNDDRGESGSTVVEV